MSLERLKVFVVVALLLSAATGTADPLPAKDPTPNQEEPTALEVSSAIERTPRVAVPLESTSYFAYAGFRDTELALRDGDDGISFCHTDKWSEACLTGLIVYRCSQYTFPLTPVGCSLSAVDFVSSLQMKRIDAVIEGQTYSLPVIFTKTLEKMIQDGDTQTDLSSLRQILVSSAKSKSRFDLWQWMSAMTNGDFDLTLARLAVLLQDTSGVAIQVRYLRGIAKDRGFDSAAMKAIDDLEEISYQLNSEILAGEDSRSWLKLYPQSDIERDTTSLVYHFYPMAFTARILQRTLHGNRLSAFLPFLFNTEYLNQTLDPEAWPFHHPKPFKVDSDFIREKMRDMYGGYAGALWGIRKTKHLPGLDRFQSDYSAAPYPTMRSYFWSMPNP